MIAVSCRQLGPADADSFARLEAELFPGDPWTAGQIEEELGSPWGFYVGAFAGENLVGTAGIKGAADADLMTMGVLPAYRRRGVARHMLELLLDQARAAGTERIFLEVRESNAAALSFYRQAGFEALRRVPGYYRRPAEAAITMVLSL